MPSTLVIQSQRTPLPLPWLKQCLQSVQSWANINHYEYRFMGDELFDPLDSTILAKTRQQTVIATDLARLIAIQHFLERGFQTVIWCDADFLIFDPTHFKLPDYSYAVGREVWIQYDRPLKLKLKAYRQVHNAFLMFRRSNSFLDFYCESAHRLIQLNEGSMPPQFIGPKLLTALHNIVQLPVQESAGMFSPLVIQDLINRGGPALELFKRISTQPVAAANLCSSLVTNEQNGQMNSLIQTLLASGRQVFNR